MFYNYFLNVIVNINSFCDLNITVNTTLKYQHMEALRKKLKLMGRAMKHFQRNYWAMKYLALWSPGLLNLFWKISKTLWPRCYILNVYSLIPKRCQTIFQDFQVSSFVWSRISKGEITNLEIPVVFPKQYVPYPHIYFWDSPIYRQQTNLR